MTPQEAYKDLTQRTKKLATLQSCGAVLAWEERTYMPSGGAEHRANQQSLIAGLAHEWFVDPTIGELLSTIESSPMVKDPDSIEAANVREIRRMYDRETKLPQKLVEEFAQTTSLAQGEWATARKKSDFKHFLPWLEKVIKLTRQVAECYGYKDEIYDALLDGYEPGMKTAEVVRVFSALRPELVELNKKIAHGQKRPDKSIVHRVYDKELQRIFGEAVAAAMGFDFDKGRLDVTTHPFCSGFGPGDTRITTRYNSHRLNDALFGIMHEAGHALYEMGIDKANHFGTPLGDAVSYSIHESQSRMWENMVGRSRAFWTHFFPKAQETFPEALGNVSADAFYWAVNDVRPSLIRVEADEATYNLHILLRFELEQALLAGDLSVADLPAAWNERMARDLGSAPPDDAQGCLQDIHWSGGSFGYFPTYTLGNLYAAQFFARAQVELGDLEEQFRRGEFVPLKKWLNQKIHREGQRNRAVDLVAAVTGEPLNPAYLLRHLREKLGTLYGV